MNVGVSKAGGYETRETYENDIIDCIFEFDLDRYKLAEFLKYKVYIEPDSNLVDILDGVSTIKDSISTEILSQWVKENFLEIPNDFKTNSQYQIALQKSQLGITDTGDEKKVFDKVISIIIKIISDKKPNYITFQADEPNRQRLYKSIVKDVLSKINTYQQINHNPVTDQPIEDGEFCLKLNP
jgi:hypothetical protein